jgi:hypothetical protein
MSYIKNAYLDLSEELGLAPAQLLEEVNRAAVQSDYQEEEELSFEDAKHQRSAERAGEEALNYWGR